MSLKIPNLLKELFFNNLNIKLDSTKLNEK